MHTKHQNKIFPLENFTHHFININRRRLSPSLRALNFLPVLPCTILVPSHSSFPQGERASSKLLLISLRLDHFLTELTTTAVEQQWVACQGMIFFFIFSLGFGGKKWTRQATPAAYRWPNQTQGKTQKWEPKQREVESMPLCSTRNARDHSLHKGVSRGTLQGNLWLTSPISAQLPHVVPHWVLCKSLPEKKRHCHLGQAKADCWSRTASEAAR